jgi:hypothetical protein
MRSSTTLVLGSAATLIVAIGCGTTQATEPAPTPATTRPVAQQQTAPTNPLPGDSSEAPAPVQGAGRGGRGGGGAAGGAQGANAAPQAYNRVVTAQAQTKNGMFKTHRIGERLLFEIPRSQMNKDILLVSEIAQTALGAGYDGAPAGNRVLRFERRDNRVLLRGISNEIMASDTLSPVAGAVAASNVHPIIAIFNVEAYGPDSAAVIDVSRLFPQPPPELSPANRIAAGYTIDATRSWIERSATFPDNVNVYSTLTLQQGNGGRAAAPAGGRGGAGRGGAGFNAPTATILASYSFHKLPDVPMEPRLCDNRVGYFSLTVTDFAGDDQRIANNEHCYITRYRLEKKDPSAAISEPVKPIVYYLDANTPMKWRPYLKKAIEDWQPAFEAAGFKNAIIAKDAPTNDPDWSPEDARYSVIRWLPSTTENASGPNIHDPRSGEILNAHVQFYHNVQNLARTWYFTQAAANDPRARMFPIPDSLMGRLLEYVLAHEVGHTIGFQHNMKASSMYPIDSIRNADFLRRMGHVSTLMDYSRFNYVVQPEDHIPAELLIPRVGPYDIWATHWGYAPIATPMQVAQQSSMHTGAELIKAAEAKRATLDMWARDQDTKPWLRFSTSGAFGSDPGDETEAVGDIDPVRATELGFKNLKRNMQWIEPATVKPDEGFDVLAELYNRQVGQFRTELGHVANLVGGMNSQEKYGNQPGVRFTPVPKARQAQAMKFLAENGLQTPTWLIDTDILRKIEPTGEVSRIVNAQSSIITSLLNDAKMTRLIESEAMAKSPSDVYTLGEMLADLRHGVFTELYGSGPVKIDVYRRGVQRAYLTDVGNKINPPAAGAAAGGRGGGGGGGRGGAAPAANTGEIKAMLRGELKQLDAELASAQKRATDVATKRHIDDARQQISHIMKPAAAVSGGAADEEGFVSRWP